MWEKKGLNLKKKSLYFQKTLEDSENLSSVKSHNSDKKDGIERTKKSK